MPSQTSRRPSAPFAIGALDPASTLVTPRVLIPVALLVAVVVLLPFVASDYWMIVLTSAAIYAAISLSVSILVGQVGLVSLGQMGLVVFGGWWALRIGYGTDLPFFVVVLLAGLITAGLGILIGLPALRVSGLHLAIITLMMAAAILVAVAALQFPNGGGGPFGYSPTASGVAQLERPGILAGVDGYFRGVVTIVAVLFVVVFLLVRGRTGRAWAAIRQSEPAALAAGVSVTRYKLQAFALAAFIAGIAGALLAAQQGGLTTYQFPVQDNITLVAVTLLAGAYTLWGPVVAGVLVFVFPVLLQNLGLSSSLALVLFGIGVLQTLHSAPLGMAGQMPKDLAKLGRGIAARFGKGRDRS
jgi:branched-chain amino acid transport system permease protein